jgi:hypothetical protein
VAQLGATLGRQFAYDLLHAISPLDEGTLQQGLRQLVEAELLYQRGIPPGNLYFKHALIQTHLSVIRTRGRITSALPVVEERFPSWSDATELPAHHYTRLDWQSKPFPYGSGRRRAVQRSVHQESAQPSPKGWRC